MRLLVILPALFVGAAAQNATGQGADGNPHNWDRIRRCDHTDYDPPCGLCEGIGGIPFGDKNEEIDLPGCSPVAHAKDIDPKTLHRPIWGTKWQTDKLGYWGVLIGPKRDPFCFQVFPENTSKGELCYQRHQGSQTYDMEGAKALRWDLKSKTIAGNISNLIVHQGADMWIVNTFPWYALGVHQCICTSPKQGGDASQASIFPLAYNWTDNLFYVGREKLDVEFVWRKAVELDHWAFGPHHVWSYPNNGSIVRAWQPFNGLEVFANGVGNSDIDPKAFDDIPPAVCKSSDHLSFKIKCDDNGYPKPKNTTEEEEHAAVKAAIAPPAYRATDKDLARAVEKTPRKAFRGDDFKAMSSVLNKWIAASAAKTKPCDQWDVEELQKLQAMLYLLRDAQFDETYQSADDNRRMRATMDDLHQSWTNLNAVAGKHEYLKGVHRDGHCHEAVMWYVHHIAEDAKKLLRSNGVEVPLLSMKRHDCSDPEEGAHAQVCKAYEEKVTCLSCHSNWTP